MRNYILRKLPLCALLMTGGAAAHAATVTWDGGPWSAGTGGNGTEWGTAANWLFDTAPTAGDSVQFNRPNLTSNTTGVTTSGSNVVTLGNQNTSTVQVGQIISGTNIPVGSYITGIVNSTTVTISNNATGTASNVSVTVANTAGLAGSPVINLGASRTIHTLVQNAQTDNFTIGSAADILAGNTLTLTDSNRNSFTGSTLTIAANVVLAPNAVGKSTWMSYDSSNGSINVTGSVGSAGAVILNKGGLTGTVAMNGANTFTGSVLVDAGTLSLGGSNAYAGDTTVSGGTLTVNFNTAAAPLTNIINSDSSLVLGGVRGGGTLTVTGKNAASTANSQTFDGTTLNAGASSLSIANGISSGTTLVNLGAISRGKGSTVNFVQPTVNTTIGAANGYTTTTGNDASGILGGYATVAGADWAMWNGTNIVAYTGYTTLAGANQDIIDGANTNVRITNGSTGAVGQAAGTVTVNTLRVTDAAARTVTIGTGNTLRLGAVGGVFSTGTNGLTIGAAGNAGTLTAGGADDTAGELILNNSTALTINSAITDNGTGAVALTKSGAGTTTLAGSNSYTGGTYINAGVVAFAPTAALTAGSTTNGGSTVTVANTAGLVVGQTITGTNIASGTRIASIVNGTQFTINQAATGAGSGLTFTTYTGGTTNALSTAGDIVVTGGTLELGSTSASQATSGAVILAGGLINNGSINKTGGAYDVRNGTITTQLAGSAGITKTTSGTVTLSNTVANTFTGDTVITEGSLVGGGAASVIAISGNLIVGAEGGGSPASFSQGNNRVTFASNKNITVYSNGSVNFGGGAQNLSGTINIIGGSLTGSQIYNQLATYNLTGGTLTGSFFAQGATYNILASSDTSTVGVGTAAGSQTFNVANGAANIDLAYTGNLGGANNLTKNGDGLMLASGSSSYTGITTINGGTLAVTSLANGASNSAIGAAAAAATNLRLGNGTTLRYTGTGHSTDRLFTVNGSAAGHSATLEASGTGAASFVGTGNIAWGSNNQTRTLKLGGTSTADNTLAATIANNGSGAVSLTKQDAGKWILTGTNTFDGATTIDGGSLIVNGSLAAGSAVTVNSGGTLGGSGTVGGSVTVNSGGFLAPGNSPGVLTVGSLDLLAGSTTSLEIAGATARGTDFDGINIGVAEGLNYGGTLSLSFSSLLTDGDTINLFSFTDTDFGDFSSVSSTGNYAGAWTQGSGEWTYTGNNQLLTFDLASGDLSVVASVVPEPSAFALAGGIVALAFAAGRRSRRRV